MNKTLELEKVLNPQQLEAVTFSDGPLLVIAGAGSGKTRTLVYRLAYLIQKGIPAHQILLLTFTRRAAEEMLYRAQKLCGLSEFRVAGGTFHSVGYNILRKYGRSIGLSQDFAILDRTDSIECIKEIKEKKFSNVSFEKGLTNRLIIEFFSKATNRNQSLEKIIESTYAPFLSYLGILEKLKREYENIKKERNLLDYDDLLLKLKILLEEDQEIRNYLDRFYKHILVDEYQDTNHLQAEILRLLNQDNQNIMAVGDDAQAIYSFRGADFRNILNFGRLFPNYKLIKLEQNYRSTQPILDLANSIMFLAKSSYTKCLFTNKKDGEIPSLVIPLDEDSQSNFISREILKLINNGYTPGDIAILSRTSYHSYALELHLKRNSIPFIKRGGPGFLESAHIKDILAHLKLFCNPSDSISAIRILKLIPGIGQKRAVEISSAISSSRDIIGTLFYYIKKFPRIEGLKNLLFLMQGMEKEKNNLDLQLQIVIDYYTPIMKTLYEHFWIREKELEQLLLLARRFEDLPRFLAEVALDPVENHEGARNSPNNERIIISTIHSAKGLEWKVVFLIWAVEGRIPLHRSFGEDEAIEEERRLLYVAVTRAKEKLYIIAPMIEPRKFSGEVSSEVSRFLTPVPEEFLKRVRLRDGYIMKPRGENFDTQTTKSNIVENISKFNPKDRVYHPIFGEGRVFKCSGANKLLVHFDSFGLKLLNLDFARLKKINN